MRILISPIPPETVSVRTLPDGAVQIDLGRPDPKDFNDDPWLSVSEAAAVARLARETVLRYIREKRLTQIRRTNGGGWIIRRSDVLRPDLKKAGGRPRRDRDQEEG